MCAIQWVRLLFILSSMPRHLAGSQGPNAPAVTEEDSDKSSSISQNSVVVDVTITYIIAENSTQCDRSKLIDSFGFSYTLKSTQIQHTGTVAYGAVTLSTEHLWCKMLMVTSTFLWYTNICMIAQTTHHQQQDWWQRSRKEQWMTYLSPHCHRGRDDTWYDRHQRIFGQFTSTGKLGHGRK